jgi:hypothetical protein
MTKIIVLMLLLSISNYCQANSIAIDAVKADEKIIHYLADKSITNFQITYQQLELGNLLVAGGENSFFFVVTSISANTNKHCRACLRLY